jgi:glycosyltransferase involved in cell wall biosynthesis
LRVAFVEDNFLKWEVANALKRSQVSAEFMLTRWESFVDLVAGALVKRGHTCVKYVPSLGGAEESYRHFRGHEVVRLPCRGSPIGLASRIEWRLGAVEFTRQLLAQDFVRSSDLIHYHSIYSSFFLASSIIPRGKKRSVQYSGGAFPLPLRSPAGVVTLRLLKGSLWRCSAIMMNEPNTMTRGEMAFLQQYLKIPRERFVDFAVTAVDPRVFREMDKRQCRLSLGIDEKTLVIVSVSAIMGEPPEGDRLSKNPFALVRLFKSVYEQMSGKVELHVIGGGAGLETLSGLVKELDLFRSVIIHGIVPHDSVPIFAGAADLVIIPLVVDDFYGDTSILEAFASNRPVCAFASRPGGSPERYGGFVIDPASDSAGKQICERVTDPSYLGQKAREGREIVKRYLLDDVAARFEQILRSVCGV